MAPLTPGTEKKTCYRNNQLVCVCLKKGSKNDVLKDTEKKRERDG